MAAPNKSFFSSLTGIITGIAGLLTATVAVLGLAGSQGWLSGGASKSSTAPGSGSPAATTSTSPSTSGSSGTGGSGGVPQYSVDPTSVAFQPVGTNTAMVKVINTGDVSMTVEPPLVTGAGASHFSADGATCSGSVDPGRSCQIQVTFNRVPGTFDATLVVQVVGASRATEVPVAATAIL